jgi:hypothetical protein
VSASAREMMRCEVGLDPGTSTGNVDTVHAKETGFGESLSDEYWSFDGATEALYRI